ncbi:MAG TPA: methyltransferase [Mucilaginibacter sp.]|jgi:tRNA1Val (adenine37-N6)-methyltransferase
MQVLGKSKIFRFKQFSVDQSGCAMKINTDGVLLGALAEAEQPKTILDIGAGTGVIALMLAQRFNEAQIDAVEIDPIAAQTATGNFANSSFAERLTVYPSSFEQFFEQHPDKKYDLIVSNPPFYINSLKSPKADKELAKHADEEFFKTLIAGITNHLGFGGVAYLILPPETADLVRNIAQQNDLFVRKRIAIYSFKDSTPHREILVLAIDKTKIHDEQFIIYDQPKVYSKQYQELLKDFFTIF